MPANAEYAGSRASRRSTPSTTRPLAPSRFSTEPTGSARAAASRGAARQPRDPPPAPPPRSSPSRRRPRCATSPLEEEGWIDVDRVGEDVGEGNDVFAGFAADRIGTRAGAAKRPGRRDQWLVPVDGHHVLELQRLLAPGSGGFEERTASQRPSHRRPDAWCNGIGCKLDPVLAPLDPITRAETSP